MPWYEPARRAPSTPLTNGVNNNNDNDEDDNTNVINYLDERWGTLDHERAQHNNNNYSSLNNNYDGLQNQVEHQLSSVFPLADFSSSSNQQNRFTSMRFGTSTSNTDEDREHAKMKSEEEHVSKTAAFFHPRPVMALAPYKRFFSPLINPSEEKKPSLLLDKKPSQLDNNDNNNNHAEGRINNNNHAPHNIGQSNTEQTNQYSQERQQYDAPSQQEFVEQQSEYVQQNHQLTPANENDNNNLAQMVGGPSQESSSSSSKPSSNLKPTDLFAAFVAKPSNDPFKLPPKQTKLVKDSNTGQMKTMHTKNNGEKRRNKTTKNWDDYGGRPVVDDMKMDDPNVNKEKASKKSKKKDKKKKSKDKNQPTQDIGDYFQNGNKKRPSNDSQENNGKKDKDAAAKSKKQKKGDRGLDTELGEIPTYNVEDTVGDSDGNNTPKLSESDFEGIENIELCNAASTMEGFQQFLSTLGKQKHVAFTMLFLDPYTGNYTTSESVPDNGGGRKKKSKKKGPRSSKFTLQSPNRGYECTTPFLPSSKKYCTPKGPMCTAWNCTCDDQIRSTRAQAALLGAMFLLKIEDIENDDYEWQCFLLPLGPCAVEPMTPQEEKCQRILDWPVTPFEVEVSLVNRWSAFEAILLNESTKLVTYNATVSLLPYYQHLASDMGSPTSLASFAACIAGDCLGTQPSQGESLKSRDDGYLRSVWDLRLASWMMRDNATDAELEFSTFREGFSHLAPDQRSPSSDMPVVMQGLLEAKNNLEILYSLYPIINEQIVNGGLLDSLECIEQPVQSILASMECRGIGFYPHRLKRIEVQIESRIEELSQTAIQITKDGDFLLSSPQQVSHFLFDVLKLSIPAGVISNNKTAHRSTSEEALRAIGAESKARTGSSPRIIDIILEFRQLNKLLTTYIRPLPKVCRRVTTKNKQGAKRKSKKEPARIYPQWMQTATRTGRLSCRKPNLQQIPNKGAFGVDPRDAFVAQQGLCLFACDYSQKEVRIMAHMSRDEALISLFRGDPNIDIYKQMSSVIRNKPIDRITDEERAQFKQVVLAILYGMSPNQVAKKLSISKANAQQMMSDFFRRFRRVKTWMDETKAYARKNSYVKTIAGRKRYLDDINSDDNAKRSQAERQAINTVIQGSAADLMKAAMINMTANLARWEDEMTRPQLLLQIHDEMILEVGFNENDIMQLNDIAIKSCSIECEKLFQLKVPLLIKCSCGMAWGAMQDIKG